MKTILRPVGYTGFLQQITWNQGNAIPATAYIWGGGGGGGGNDSGRGGNGGGAAFTQVQFTVNEGDTIEVAIGQGGGTGQSGVGDAAGGTAGASYTTENLFNTISNTASPPVFAQFNSAYCTFLNTYGVWISPSSAAVFDRTYTVNFPFTDNYQFTAAADNSAIFYIDGVERFRADNFQTPYTVGYEVPAGNHTIRIVGQNTGGPGAVALTIGQGDSYSGGRGGNSGTSGSSGAGGGGGGATVVLLNGTEIAIAGGGGGGGGGGNAGVATGQNAPGDRGQASVGDNAGQNGTNKAGDGGGGGGGGGGLAGGQGGMVPGGDQGGYAGAFGSSSGAYVNPNGRNPGGQNNAYYRSGVGVGGAFAGVPGNAGYAVFEFEVPGTFVHQDGTFQPVNQTYIKTNNTWTTVRATYIKEGGNWLPVNGSIAPAFENIPGRFGVNPRSGVVETPAGDPISEGGISGGFDGGGGGGSKVICTALYQLGMMPEELYEHDQRFGKWLYENDPVAYKGYRKWADVLVEYMQGRGRPLLPKLMFWKTPEQQQIMSHKIALKVGHFVGYAFAQEIARRAGHKVPFTVGGWLVVSAGLKMCKAIGYLYGLHKKSRNKK